MSNSPFAGMREASREHNSNWFKPGAYLCRIDEVKLFQKKSGENVFKAEMTVVQVIDDNGGSANRLGEQIGHLIPSGGFKFLERVKGFIACATGSEDHEVDEGATEYSCGDAQPLAGFVLQVSARDVPTKAWTPEEPKFFTHINYEARIPDADVPALLGENFERFFPSQK